MIDKEIPLFLDGIKELLQILLETNKEIGIAIAFTMESEEFKTAHWLTRFSREDGIELFEKAIEGMKMQRENIDN
jgi:hypothetical protein